MTHRLAGAGLAAAVLALGAAPAQAQTTDTYFFQCAGPQPAAKIQFGIIAPVLWSTTKPSASYTSGAGCGFHDAPAPGGTRLSDTPENAYDAFYKGEHGKAIESIELELHNLVTSRVRQGTTQKLTIRVMEGTGLEYAVLAEKEAEVTPVASSTGATERFDVELTGLKIKPKLGRQLTIGVHSSEATSQAWVAGASEIPAGVTFTEPAPLPAPAS